jgi:hypothetical protein
MSYNCWMNDFNPVPLSEKTLSLCDYGCKAPGDNVLCCCWMATPFAFVIDIVTCCPRCVCYKCQEYKKNKQKTIITIQPL